MADRLGLAVEGDQHLHRAEDLFLGQGMVGRHVVDQCRAHVVAAARRAVDELALGDDDEAVVARQAEVVLDHHLLPLRDHRADVEVERRRADAQRPVALGHAGAHRLEQRPLDQDARGRRAGLPGVLDAGVDEKGQRRVEVGIGEDDLRALAAELERDRDHVRRGRGLHPRAGGDRAGERQMVDARMRRQRRARFLAEPGHDVERPRRQAGLERDPGEREHRQAGLLGGLRGRRRCPSPARRRRCGRRSASGSSTARCGR